MSENTATASPTSESIYSSVSKAPVIDWSSQHEKILVDWADKATCYKWLH